jgi:hypothetical protein
MSRSGLNSAAAVVGTKIAAVPGATEQRGELAGVTAEGVEHGREFLREQEKTAVDDRLLIAQRMEDGSRCGASGGDATCRPERVCFGEEAGDLAPAGSLAGLARFADEDNEEIETVARGTDTAVRDWADEVAEGSQELEEDGGRVSFRVWGEAANDATRDTVESRDGKRGRWGRGGCEWKRDRRLGVFAGVRVIGVRVLESLGFLLLFFQLFLLLFLLLRERTGFFRKVSVVLSEKLGRRGRWLRRLLEGLVIEQLSTPAVYGGCCQRAGEAEGVLSECHDVKLLRF